MFNFTNLTSLEFLIDEQGYLVNTYSYGSRSTNPDILICPVDHFFKLRISVFKSASIHNGRDDVGDCMVYWLSCVKWLSLGEEKYCNNLSHYKILQRRFTKNFMEAEFRRLCTIKLSGYLQSFQILL